MRAPPGQCGCGGLVRTPRGRADNRARTGVHRVSFETIQCGRRCTTAPPQVPWDAYHARARHPRRRPPRRGDKHHAVPGPWASGTRWSGYMSPIMMGAATRRSWKATPSARGRYRLASSRRRILRRAGCAAARSAVRRRSRARFRRGGRHRRITTCRCSCRLGAIRRIAAADRRVCAGLGPADHSLGAPHHGIAWIGASFYFVFLKRSGRRVERGADPGDAGDEVHPANDQLDPVPSAYASTSQLPRYVE